MNKFEKIEADTLRVYEENAIAFDQKRSKICFEKKWLNFFATQLTGKKVLDVGCGSAEPISKYLIDQGFQVTGIDFSKNMIDLARSRYPKNEWCVEDMRDFSIGKKYNSIIAWNSFFHLNEEGQRMAMSRFRHHLESKGFLMMTVGPARGEVLGEVNGEVVYHFSMNPEEYENELKTLGFGEFHITPEDPECLGHTILTARLL